MKKLFLFFLFCPFLASAQSLYTYPNEIAFSPLPAIGLMGVEIQNQPFFIEYKRKKEKRYLRLGIQLLREVSAYNINPTFDLRDTVIVLDSRLVGKEYGHFKIGTEYQKKMKGNERVRLRTGLDALIGIKSTSYSGVYSHLNLKTNKIETDRSGSVPLSGTVVNVLSAGCSGFFGIDILLGNRTYLGLTLFTNATLNGMNQSKLEVDMKLSPYLAVKF